MVSVPPEVCTEPPLPATYTGLPSSSQPGENASFSNRLEFPVIDMVAPLDDIAPPPPTAELRESTELTSTVRLPSSTNMAPPNW